MANSNSNVITAKNSVTDLPTANQLRTGVIPRLVEGFPETQRHSLHTLLTGMTQVFDTTVSSFDKQVRTNNYSNAGRELVAIDAFTEATGMLRVQSDAATRHHRDHLAQLREELADVPAINEFRATEIRALL